MLVFCLRTVKFGGSMFRAGRVVGGLQVLGLGKDVVKRESPELGADFLASSSIF